MTRWKVNSGYPSALPLSLLVLAVCLGASSLSAQALPLKRDVPGSASLCPAMPAAHQPEAEEQRLARQLASTAAQAVILGDLDRARSLLDQATRLDSASADLAYRHARVLEDLGRGQDAAAEYCRVLAIDSTADGVGDARQRLAGLVSAERSKIPDGAISAFEHGLLHADKGRLERAAASFDSAATQAPEWPEAVYDRGVVSDRLGRPSEASRDLSKYLDLQPGASDALAVSRRIGELQSLALASTPSPDAALFLGMVVPGMGQFYSGNAPGGLAVLALAGGAVAAGFFIKKVDVQCLSDPGAGGTCPQGQVVAETSSRPYLAVSAEAAAAVTLVGAVAAFMSARERRSKARVGSAPGGSTAVGLRLAPPTIQPNGRRVDLSLIRVVFR